MTQPTALRLADALEQDYCSCHEGFKLRNRIDPQCESCQTRDWREEAAAELRRLHTLIAACEPYLKENETPAERIERDHRDSLALMTLLAREKKKNEALLEALRVFVSCAFPVSTEIDERGHRWTEAYLDQALPIARAAIAKAEGEKP